MAIRLRAAFIGPLSSSSRAPGLPSWEAFYLAQGLRTGKSQETLGFISGTMPATRSGRHALANGMSRRLGEIPLCWRGLTTPSCTPASRSKRARKDASISFRRSCPPGPWTQPSGESTAMVSCSGSRGQTSPRLRLTQFQARARFACPAPGTGLGARRRERLPYVLGCLVGFVESLRGRQGTSSGPAHRGKHHAPRGRPGCSSTAASSSYITPRSSLASGSR